MNEQSKIDLTEMAKFRLASTSKCFFILAAVAMVGGLAALANSLFVDQPGRRLMQAYLVAFAFVLSLSLGAMFFVLVQHLMRAGWSVVVRRFAEVLGLNILFVGLLFLPIAWSVWQGNGLIYSWSSTTSVHSDPTNLDAEVNRLKSVSYTQANTEQDSITQPFADADLDEAGVGALSATQDEHGAGHVLVKPFLNNSRFLGTWVVLFAVWISLGVYYFRCSVRQDETGNVDLTRRMEWWSGIATILFGLSLTLGAFDLLMSLDPLWYSTIFGVYYFAGCAVAGISLLLLIVLLLSRTSGFSDVLSEETQRDLGRLLFAFVFFWAYISFSQYMLLWYANMPETTSWLVRRGMSTATEYTNSWGWLAIFLLFGHFMIPFCGLMSRHVKSNSNWMIFWCLWMLVTHFFDIYWIVIPEYHHGLTISFVEIGIAVAMIALYLMAAIWIASRISLFAVGDPRMGESLTRHAVY